MCFSSNFSDLLVATTGIPQRDIYCKWDFSSNSLFLVLTYGSYQIVLTTSGNYQ